MDARKFPILEPEGASIDLTLEQRYTTLMNGFKHQYFAWGRQIADRYGWEKANEIAQAVTDESVPYIASGYTRRFNLKSDGAALVSQVMQAEFLAEGSEPAVTAETPESAEFKVLCMFGNALQSGKFPIELGPGLCHEGCLGWGQRVAETIDPLITVDRLTWMGDGAERCNFQITRRPGAGTVTPAAP
jgi:hypothetical protein